MTELTYQITEALRPKRILRIPESHTLHIGPRACSRRQGVRALRNGVAEHISFLSLSETDIIMGDYVTQAQESVEILLITLAVTPRAFILYVNCIDDFLGTDEHFLLETLNEQFPSVHFLLSHINPIAGDVEQSNSRSIHTKLYDLLEPQSSKDTGITLVGNFETIPLECEFYDLVHALQIDQVRQLVSCKSFQEYLDLAKSQLTISLSHLGDEPAALMDSRFDIPYLSWHACYDINEVGKRYDELTALIGHGAFDYADIKHETTLSINAACAAVGAMPIIIDSSSSLQPFSLARALLSYGFNVTAIFALHVKDCDEDARSQLEQDYPDLLIIQHESYEVISGYGISPTCISVGTDAAFLLRAEHSIDMHHDEGYFGFQGIGRLMKELAAAGDTTHHWSI